MGSIGLERLVENKEESTVERVRKSIISEKAFDKVYGMKDVKENLMTALEQASFISKQGYIPILLLIGPSGSGKTEIINNIIRAYKKYSISNEMFTLNIKGAKCSYNENPYNLYRSILPIAPENSDSNNVSNNKRPEVCSQCEHNLEDIIENGKISTEKIKLDRIYPQSSIIEFGNNLLLPTFIDVIINSNRSILTISVDKSRLEDIDPGVFQLLNNIYDNNFSDSVGNRIPLDSLIIMHSNETFMEMNEEQKKESRPLLERIIRVNVRRNLSYSQEIKLAEESKIPIKKLIPHFLEYIAKFNVLSRIDDEEISTSDYERIDNVLELLDYYDSSNLKEFEKNMTQSMSNFLSDLLPDYSHYISVKDMEESRYIRDAARSIIYDSNDYKSGWTSGISSRSISSILNFNYNSSKPRDSLLFSDIASYVKKNEEKIEDNTKYNKIKSYIDSAVTNDVRFEIDYALLSFYFGEHFNDYTNAISEYTDSILSSKQPQEFKDTNGYLMDAGRYFDLDELNSQINAFKLKKIPLGIVNYKAKFEDIMYFLVSTGTAYIKKESKFKNFIGEKGKDISRNSELYPYIKNFLVAKRGYFDEAVEEALKIYKEGTLFYDE
jgi:predicted Ser/Thr protein kinase